MKKDIPNILTFTRIILTPIIIILGFLKKWKAIIILAIICAITDLFDGKIARKYNLISESGAKLDTIADKVFAIGLICTIIPRNKYFLILLILEIIIAITNLYYHYKTNIVESLMIGKFKTTFLFITIIFAYITIFYPKLNFIFNGFNLATINLQVLCILQYFCNYYININKQNDNSIQTNKNEDLIDLAERYGTINDNEIDNY